MTSTEAVSPAWLRAPHEHSLGRHEGLDREHLIITLKTAQVHRHSDATSSPSSPSHNPAHSSLQDPAYQHHQQELNEYNNPISEDDPTDDERIRFFVPPTAHGTEFGNDQQQIQHQLRIPPKSLSLFSRHATLRVPRSRLNESPYFANLLDADWKNLGSVELEFANVRLMEAYMAALLCVADPQFSLNDHIWDRSTELLVISSASMFGCSALQERAEQLALTHLCERTVIPVVRLAERLGRFELKRGVFRWLCRTGVLAERGSIMSQMDRALYDVAMSNNKNKDNDRLMVTQDGNLRFGARQRLSAALFTDCVRSQIRQKQKFFRSGLPMSDLLCADPDTGLKAGGFPGLVKCYVERIRNAGAEGRETHYVLRDEATGDVVIAACNIKGSSEFIFATKYPSAFLRHAEDFLANLTCNFVGTTFTIHDYGCSSDELPPHAFPEAMRAEHGAIVYETNVLGHVPNAMTVLLPHVRNIDTDFAAGLGVVERHKRGLPGVMQLRTKRAKWNRRVEAWTMDFKGRVVVASKKNFQLVDSSGPLGEVLMSFGKVKKHRFSLDFKEPLSCIQAFSVALSSFANKLVVTS